MSSLSWRYRGSADAARCRGFDSIESGYRARSLATDGELVVRVARSQDLSLHGDHGQAEELRIHSGEIGDIVGVLALGDRGKPLVSFIESALDFGRVGLGRGAAAENENVGENKAGDFSIAGLVLQ